MTIYCHRAGKKHAEQNRVEHDAFVAAAHNYGLCAAFEVKNGTGEPKRWAQAIRSGAAVGYETGVTTTCGVFHIHAVQPRGPPRGIEYVITLREWDPTLLERSIELACREENEGMRQFCTIHNLFLREGFPLTSIFDPGEELLSAIQRARGRKPMAPVAYQTLISTAKGAVLETAAAIAFEEKEPEGLYYLRGIFSAPPETLSGLTAQEVDLAMAMTPQRFDAIMRMLADDERFSLHRA